MAPLGGESLPDLTLNLTPDAYNALLGIHRVLSPENTREEVTRQFKEKQSILGASSFKRQMLALGVRESRLTNNWQSFFVVFSGSYIYFYKEEQDLMPYHYLYVVSISAHAQAPRQRTPAGPAKTGKERDEEEVEREATSPLPQLDRKRLSTSTPDRRTRASKTEEHGTTSVLVLRGRNGEQISLNFASALGRTSAGAGSGSKQT